MAKSRYEIIEKIGDISKPNGSTISWAKAILRTMVNGVECIDVRKFKDSDESTSDTISIASAGKGITLTKEETDNMVDMLLSLGYGSHAAIEKSYKSNQGLCGVRVDD